ncbi:MAG TPA: D-alanyl-D-alanine carboxypeptidase family protein [Gaiellaceae bacterium]|nr:D-alanyl-D-alanine carboxypeptidase family protein [Gaiellaceae bacterium]
MRLRLLVAAAATLVFATPAHAGPPAVSARAYFVVNPATGEVLAQKHAWSRVPIASITKLMTVIVALDHAKWHDVVHVRSDAADVGESTINLRAGERITVGDLVKGALIQSANDAADALADYVGHGNERAFVGMMNARASELGLTRTHFARPDGLDAPAHYSTALDVTRLAETAMQLPQVRSVVRERTASISGGRTLHTWNDLLGVFRGVYGVKTGHTSAAGWCQVAAVRRNGVTLYTTVLGSPTRSQRNADLASLLRWGISRYRPTWVVQPQRIYLRAEVGYGKAAVPLVAARGAVGAVRVDRPLVERVVARSTLKLPVARGQRAGEVRVYSGKRLIARRALVAQRSVSRPGFARRVGFYVSRTLHHIGSWFS